MKKIRKKYTNQRQFPEDGVRRRQSEDHWKSWKWLGGEGGGETGGEKERGREGRRKKLANDKFISKERRVNIHLGVPLFLNGS